MDETFVNHMREVNKQFGPERHAAIPLYEDPTRYPIDRLVALASMEREIMECRDADERAALISKFSDLRKSIRLKENAPERIYLWPEGKMPQLTEYTNNSDLSYTHDPDFKPYLLELLLPEDAAPVGTVVLIAGGEHGAGTINECYQVGIEFNERGYQCFILHNRPNMRPWNGYECGADTARAIRYIRANAAKYRINPNRIAAAGFSNGGLTVEFCIRYYSGRQTVADHFSGYVPDELDRYGGSPDLQLCIYGPRFKTDTSFDYSGVVYPPSFFAIGREDKGAMANLFPVFSELTELGIPAEVHTFSGHPHGYAGWKIFDGKGFPNFDLWLPLADHFMKDAYNK
jgi:hypothetical protein